ncbi:MFS transporter small subunit [Actinomycetospora sp.]|jgi:hypothetical protein
MSQPTSQTTSPSRTVITIIAWAWVIIPFLYGVWQLVIKLPALF